MYLLMVFYTMGWVYVFYKLDLWTVDLLKDTIFWILFAGSVTLFKINTVSEDKTYFREAVKENIKFTIILEFVGELYNFSLWIELLLVPLVVLIGGMLAIAENQTKYESAKKFLKFLLSIGGIIFLIHIGKELFAHTHDIVTEEHIKELLLKPALSLLFLPFVYVLSLYMQYQTGFVMISFNIKSPELLKYAKYQSWIKFKNDTEGLKRWQKRLHFLDIDSKESIDQSIDSIKERQMIEKEPPIIDPLLGWSPFEAGDFLSEHNLKTGYYEHFFEKEWSSTSQRRNIGDTWNSNAITYTVIGTSDVATSLELILHLFTPKSSDNAKFEFLKSAKMLFKKVFSEEMPSQLEAALNSGKKFKLTINDIDIHVKQALYHNTTNGFDQIFRIAHKVDRL